MAHESHDGRINTGEEPEEASEIGGGKCMGQHFPMRFSHTSHATAIGKCASALRRKRINFASSNPTTHFDIAACTLAWYVACPMHTHLDFLVNCNVTQDAVGWVPHSLQRDSNISIKPKSRECERWIDKEGKCVREGKSERGVGGESHLRLIVACQNTKF